MTDKQPYDYHAKLISVVDGDTFTVDVDLGFHLTNRERVRLVGVDTAEIHFVEEGSEEWNAGMAQADFTRKVDGESLATALVEEFGSDIVYE